MSGITPATPKLALVRKELLKAMRGRRTQMDLSVALGFKFNQVFRWESGSTRLTWSEFIRVAETCQTPIASALREILDHTGDPKDSGKLLTQIVSRRDLAAEARALGVSETKLRRWMRNEVAPSLSDVFACIARTPTLLEQFIGRLVNLEDVTALSQSSTSLRAFGQFQDMPWATLVWEVLELTEYQKATRHIPGFVARALNLTLAQERQALRALLHEGYLEFANGKYRVKTRMDGEFRGGHPMIALQTEFWTKQALARYKTPNKISDPVDKPNVNAFLTVCTSRATHCKIREAFIDFYHRAGEIIRNDTGPREAMRIMLFHFFEPADLAQSAGLPAQGSN